MKWFLVFWGGPIMFLGLWYGLSYYDMNFGIYMLRRDFNDLVFQIYGNVLGLPPEILPGLVAKAIVTDSAVLFAIIGFRRRKQIAAWWSARRSRAGGQRLLSDDNLSSAP